MNEKILNSIVVVLALMMWYSHADIFYRLESSNGIELSTGFTILNTFLAIGFSGLTSACVRYVRQYRYVAVLAAFDSVALFLHFQKNIDPILFNWIGSIFLGLFLFMIVSMIWVLSDMLRSEKEKETAKTEESKQEAEPQAQPAQLPAETNTVTVFNQTTVIAEDAYLKAIRTISAYRGNMEKIHALYDSLTPEVKEKVRWRLGTKYNLQ